MPRTWPRWVLSASPPSSWTSPSKTRRRSVACAWNWLAQAGGEIIAAEISKRLTSLKSARSFVDWHKRRDFVKDLDLQRTMIVDRLAPTRPDLALDLMWRFLDLAEPVLNRVDDSNGTVGDVFRAACNDLGAIASAAKLDPARLAERVFAAVTHNNYGVLDNLVRAICPALGEAGMAQLKARLTAAQAKRPATDRFDGRSYALRAALQDIADAEGNVDAYIALVPASARKQPGVGRRDRPQAAQSRSRRGGPCSP